MICFIDRAANVTHQEDFKVADLLVRAGALTAAQLSEAQQKAKHNDVRLIETLVNGGYVAFNKLDSAVTCYQKVRNGELDMFSAIRVLNLACETDVSLMDILKRLGNFGKSEHAKGTLGQMLVAAQLVSGEQLESALRESVAKGLPLGRMLVLHNELPEPYLEAALELQVQVREGAISLDDAISKLKEDRKHTLEENCFSKIESSTAVLTQNSLRLEQMLALAGVLSRSDMLHVLEITALSEDRSCRDVIVELGFVANDLVEQAVVLQKMVASHLLTPSQAVISLRHAVENRCSVEQSIKKLKVRKHEVAERSSDLLPIFLEEHAPAESVVDCPTGAFQAMHDTCVQIAQKYLEQGQYQECAQMYRRVIEMTERALGTKNETYSEDLTHLASILCLQGKFADAVPSMLEAIDTLETSAEFTLDWRTIATRINMLADIYLELELYDKAEPLLSRALSIREFYLPPDHPDIGYTLRDYGYLLRKTNRILESRKIFVQAKSSQEITIPPYLVRKQEEMQ